MAGEKKQIRILSKSEQKQTIKGIQKPKKNIIKNYLESPFVLEWPDLTTDQQEEITSLIHKTCKGLRKLECKPPWKQVAKYKGAERKTFLMEYNKKYQENLDPESIKQNEKTKEALSHLIFGFNAVMRGLEKDRIAGILVKKNVDPVFVTKSFLPGCAKKCIPLVPLNDLDVLLKDKATLALPHNCMVLGLKNSVKEESNLFYPLYTKMCEALIVEEDEDVSIDEDVSENDDAESNTIDLQPSSKCSHKISEAEISSYHLKRNSKSQRAFIPHAQEIQENEANPSMDFLSFNAVEAQHNTLKPNEAELENEIKDKSKKSNVVSDKNIDFSNMILIDASGDENMIENDKVKKETAPEVKKAPNKDSKKAKRKAKEVNHDSYVPAKTKRLKGNPDRKTKSKK